MKIAIIILSVLIVLLLAAGSFLAIKYIKLNNEYVKTYEWGYAMRDEAIKYSDLYRNLKNFGCNKERREDDE